ncbi:carbohydrate ABC transporter permease [Micromonospora sp. DR5-3]|uniref:carbohydrate ABC transporter permease n=1 Tax=unclassified Micromonospora TaxID=2617518 RepID=UPI0011D944B5|nr:MULTISPECIES: carbohydrate ABC transporter permease [unclassified Micromonospora]MCW3816026.1 carbohydrate ABC transporter permease [Micromonospora sp. DR5-3]TYC21293.1 carbohydrate ABC transporter permease [Micromonospora sp. MP36]
MSSRQSATDPHRSRPQRALRSGRRGSPAAQLSTMVLLLAVAGYFLLPVWWLVVSATKSSGDLFGTNGFWFGSNLHVADNVTKLFQHSDGAFSRWILNSVLYAGGGALAATLIATMAGYALAKYPFRGREGVFAVIIGAVLIPPPLLALPLYLLASAAGVVDTYWSVLIPSVVTPFGVYLARVYAAASVPDELIDAARVDGAGELRIFFTVALRLMTPALVTICLFQFVGIWNNFFLPLMMLADDKLWPLTLGLYFWNSQLRDQPWYDIVITGSLISVVPLVVAFLALQRYWRSGLSAGSIKA